MATLKERLLALVADVGGKLKAINTSIGSLAALPTTDKTSLVAALTELHTALGEIEGGAGILDTAGAGDTTHTWSADKIILSIAAAIDALKGGAPAAMDTLFELSQELDGADTAITNLLTAVGNRVSYADAQTLTAEQKLQACNNIGIGDPDVDLVAALNTAMA